MGIVDLWAFMVASVLLILSPGPGTLAILGSSVQSRRAGFTALAGTSCGDAVLMAAASIGAATLLHGFPLAFTLLKYTGGAYLAWLGIKGLLSHAQGMAISAPPPGGAWRRSFFVTLLNPKAIVFFMAFFPQFVRPNAGFQAFMLLGILFIAMNCLYQTLLILGAQRISTHMDTAPRLGLWVNRLLGVVFIGFGLRLALG